MKKRISTIVMVVMLTIVSITAGAQTIQDFHGNWKGLSQSGDSIEVTLNSNWTCVFKINNVQVFANNAIVVYRLPGYHSSQAGNFVNGAPQLIRFYTQNAMQGILAPGTQVQSGEETFGIPQTYTGLALIAENTSGLSTMDLFIDVANFSSAPPQITLGSSDDEIDIEPTIPFCHLIKQ